MIKKLFGKKLGMTRYFLEEGKYVPVTIVKAGPCVVIQKKRLEKDGYEAIQVGFDVQKEKRLNKSQQGHFKAAGDRFFSHLREIRVEDADNFELGQEIKSDIFKIGELVNVTGRSKGRGFSGVIKSATAGWRSDMNYIVYRYGEVLLIAAEAANEIGNTPEAVGYVNQIRARARAGGNINWEGGGYGSYPPSDSPADVSAGISQDDFRNLVLEERRIELAFEYKRWHDIVRRDLGDQVFGPDGLETQPNFDKSKHYLIPIPQTEIDMSPNLEPQNPGY